MATLEKLKKAFAECRGPFPFRDFERLIGLLGYAEVKAGKTGGSRRKYRHQQNDAMIFLDEPHSNGSDMGMGMVKRLQKMLRERGEI